MAGREYKARSKTVQKMSRDGLVEENLGTGKTRKLVTGNEDGVRIGDRPMEDYTEEHGRKAGREAGRNLSLDRHGRTEDTGKGTADPGGEDPDSDTLEGNTDLRKRKSRNHLKNREPSSEEAPSSVDQSAGFPGEKSFADSRMRSSGQDMYRLGHGTQPAPDSSASDSRRRIHRQFYQRENAPQNEKNGPGLQTENTDSLHSDEMYRLNTESMYTLNDHSSVTGDPAGDRSAAASADESDPAQEESAESAVSRQSRRAQGIRGHPSGGTLQAAQTAGAFRHGEPSRREDPWHVPEKTAGSRLREDSAEMDGLDSLKDEIRSRQKKERLNQEQRKARAASRLSFDDDGGMVRGSGTGFSRKAGSMAAKTAVAGMSVAAGAALAAAHRKVSETEDENTGVQAAHHAELFAEDSIRRAARHAGRVHDSAHRASASRRKAEEAAFQRLNFDSGESARAVHAAKTEAERKSTVKKFFRKQRQRRIYVAAKREEKTVEQVFRAQQNIVTRAASVVKEAIIRNSRTFLVIGIFGILFLLVSASLGSCAALMQGAGSSVVSTTYPSTDEDIYAVENRYRELEAGLNAQVNSMRQAHPSYDEFRYQIDEITHNPYHLISYFTAKYGQFTYDQVKDELEEIFREQYTLTTTGEQNLTITETQTIQPGESLGQVVTSGYCSCEICCGPYAGGTTASGVYPVSNHTIAVDAFDPFVPMGTHVIMNGTEYVVEDTGGFARFGVQFDVYYDDHQTALTHGHQLWEAYLASDNPDGALEVTTTRTINRMSVILTNHDLDEVLQNRLTEDEKVRYALYNYTYGNRDYLFDLNSLPAYGRASSDYTIPPEALSDERFARMIAEAEKYLGVPYVWGGYSPSGFDCSGFVSWVINHCGNGWDYGRQTAEGLRQICYYVSPEDARPGDLVFFEHTYETAGASHIGIYVGNGMMIHAGEPVQYTSLNSDYWSSHLMQYGRLP